MRALVTTAVTTAVVLYLLAAGLGLGSDRLIFQPQPSSYSDASPPFDRPILKLRSGNGDRAETISAVYLPNPQATYTILFSHGNGEDIGHNAEYFAILRQAGFAVFAYDYRGYGTSEGRPTEAGVYLDAQAAYDYLVGELKVPPERVLVMGRSVGSGPAVHLAASNRVGGLILEAPFLSAFRVLTRVPLLPFDRFNNARKIGRVQAPVLVIHGREDEVIPFSHGQKLWERANPQGAADAPLTPTGGKRHYWIDGAGHNNIFPVANRTYLEVIRQFAADIPRGAPSVPNR